MLCCSYGRLRQHACGWGYILSPAIPETKCQARMAGARGLSRRHFSWLALAVAVHAATASPRACPATAMALEAGRGFLERGSLQEALGSFKNALRRRPKLPEVHELLAETHARLGNGELASKHLQRLTKLRLKAVRGPTHTHSAAAAAVTAARAHYHAAKHHLRHRRLAGSRAMAIASLREVLRADPTHAPAKHWLSHQLSKNPGQPGHEEAARLLGSIHDLSKLVDSDPLDTLMLLGQAEERCGNLAASIAAFERACRMFKQREPHTLTPAQRRRFALSHFQLGRLLLLQSSLGPRRVPGGTGDQDGEAPAAAAADWRKKALGIARRASRLFPDSFEVHDLLSWALEANGDLGAAIQNYRMALADMDRQGVPMSLREMPERVFGSSLARLLDRHARRGTMDHQQGPGDGTAGIAEEHEEGLRCAVDRYADVSSSTLHTDYFLRNRPVIFSSVDGHPVLEGWPALKRWTLKRLLADKGNLTVEVRRSSHVAYDNEFGGLPRERVLLHDYLLSLPNSKGSNSKSSTAGNGGSVTNAGNASWQEEDPPYLFGGDQELRGALADDYVEPAVFSMRKLPSSSTTRVSPTPYDAVSVFAFDEGARRNHALFYLGGAQTSVSLHTHTNAWNALVFGHKKWYLLPPYTIYGPTGLPMSDWISSPFYTALRPDIMECDQRAGEIIWVPSDWTHGVMNLASYNAGVAVEVGSSTTMLRELLKAK